MRKTTSPVSQTQLLSAITSVLSQYIAETDPYILFNGMLDKLLEMTDSEYGFIGEVFYNSKNEPFIKSYATSNIAWSEETNRLYEQNKLKGMVFPKLNSLYGSVLKTGQLVIANQPSTDPRSGGLPDGHPPLNAFMGLPFYGGGKLLGVVGIANREKGYQQDIADALHPFLVTCGNLIQAYQNNQKHLEVAAELHRLQLLETSKSEEVSLGFDYVFTSPPVSLNHQGRPILLSKKEGLLLEVLVKHQNQTLRYQHIEEYIWPNLVLSESSLRSLVRRLRKKLPLLTIKATAGVGYMLFLGK